MFTSDLLGNALFLKWISGQIKEGKIKNSQACSQAGGEAIIILLSFQPNYLGNKNTLHMLLKDD